MSTSPEWRTISLRHLVTVHDGKRTPLNSEERADRVGPYPYWGSGGVVGYVDRPLFRGTLVLLGEDGAPFFDRDRPVAFRIDEPVWVNNHIHVLRPALSMDASFLTYFLNQVDYSLYITGSTRDKLTQEDLREIAISVPPLDVQRQIAEYLDRETGKIDELIAKQEQLISIVQERTRSVILRALEASGAPTVPLKHLWQVIDCKHLTAEFVEFGFPVASIRETEGRYLDLTGAKRTTKQFYDALVEGNRQPQAGDLIFTRNATVGRVSEIPQGLEPFAIGQDVCLLKSTGNMLPRFAQLILESSIGTDQLDLAMVGSTFKRVNVEQVRSMLIPAPPLSEQTRIVSQLDSEIASCQALESRAGQITMLLHERRAALISAAVTGKIDVRGL